MAAQLCTIPTVHGVRRFFCRLPFRPLYHPSACSKLWQLRIATACCFCAWEYPRKEGHWLGRLWQSKRGASNEDTAWVNQKGFYCFNCFADGRVGLDAVSVFALSNTADGHFELEGSAAARDKWARAVSRAEQEGGLIFEGVDCQVLSGDPLPIAGARTVSVSKNQTIGLIYDTVIISANYAVTSANKISPFNWATINCSASSISSSHYDRAVLDNGRTNAIHYHAEIKAAGGWPTYVGDYYAEFYYTFTGTMS